MRPSPAPASPDVPPRNPLQLAGALQMAVLFQVVLMAVHVAGRYWGESGVFTSAAILGLTDADALTLSMARGAAERTSAAVAAAAIALGVLTNTGMKLVLAQLFGSPRFRLITGGTLALMLLAIGAAFVYQQPFDW